MSVHQNLQTLYDIVHQV